jgi:5-methylcytosine-specific restriction endonuclease McrBC regulatory subunit McrC
MIRTAFEGDITWLSGLSASDIPYPLPSGIRVLVQGAKIGLEVLGVVGSIPLRNGDTLQIIPKIGRVNFLRLLFRAEGNQTDLESSFEEFVQLSVTDEASIDTAVSRHLLFSAEEILKRSPLRGRVARRHRGSFAAGRIDVLATVLNLASRQEEPVVYVSKDKTEDIPENRVITEAIIRVWATLQNADHNNFRHVYDRWVKRFPRSRTLGADLEKIEQRFASRGYGGGRDYYRKALMVSQVVLGTNGIGLGEGSSLEGDAIVINTADVFEKYLRSVITRAYAASGYIVTKGGVGTASLYVDGKFELIPDIVVDRNQRTVLIADAKYKVPTASDHYQMATYLAAKHVSSGLLLSPRFDDGEIEIREYATATRVAVREVFLPMNDLEATEKFLGTIVERFGANRI